MIGVEGRASGALVLQGIVARILRPGVVGLCGSHHPGIGYRLGFLVVDYGFRCDHGGACARGAAQSASEVGPLLASFLALVVVWALAGVCLVIAYTCCQSRFRVV